MPSRNAEPQPHSPEAERAVLGALLLPSIEPAVSARVFDMLTPKAFHSDQHARVFAAMVCLYRRGAPIDLITVSNGLRETGDLVRAGGEAYLTDLFDGVVTAANVLQHAGIVKDFATRPAVLAETEKLARLAGDGADVEAIRERAGALLHQLAEARDGTSPRDSGPALALVRLDSVPAEPVTWLWPGRIPRGKLTVIVGDPGLAKSFLTLDLASRVTRGFGWPDGGTAPAGPVVLLTAEDGLADTVRPRVDVMGGDAARVAVLTGIRRAGAGDGTPPSPFDLARDLAHLEAAVRETRAVLVIVDPLSAYLGATDSHNNAEVRGLLAPLAALAERTTVAIVAVMHFGKNTERRALLRALGSVGLVAAPRAVFAVAPDADDDARRLLLCVKMNVAPHPPGLAYRLEPTRHPDGFEVARVAWDAEPVTMTADDALAAPGHPGDRAERLEADELLADLLRDGERPAAEVFKAARANGIPDRTLKRAKARLGVRTRHEGQPGQKGAWYWSLPGPTQKVANLSAKGAIVAGVVPFEESLTGSAYLTPTSPKGATVPSVAPFDAPGDTLRDPAGSLDEVDPWDR
jgi:hypothetical protein